VGAAEYFEQRGRGGQREPRVAFSQGRTERSARAWQRRGLSTCNCRSGVRQTHELPLEAAFTFRATAGVARVHPIPKILLDNFLTAGCRRSGMTATERLSDRHSDPLRPVSVEGDPKPSPHPGTTRTGALKPLKNKGLQ
jgi:hypothetical protein